jgi:hypothetical protein
MSEKSLPQPEALDKALRLGFAFLVEASARGDLAKVTIFDLDGEPFTTLSGLIPGAWDTLEQAAELALLNGEWLSEEE